MSKKKIKFYSYAEIAAYGDKVGIWLQCPKEDAKNLHGVLCKIQSQHWSWWEILRGKFIAKRLTKLFREEAQKTKGN